MGSFKYERYISRVTEQPWALLPSKLAELTELMRFRAAGNRLSDEEIAARFGSDNERPSSTARAAGAIAVVNVHGVIAHRADSFEASSGGTSAELIGRYIDRTVADETVTGILIDFDTPGGSVEGIPELAAKIAKATAVKPITAHLNAMAASAGFWLASQCSEIVITPSGMAGSIGVYLVLIDESEKLANEGIVVNAISAGTNKLEGAPWQPMSDATRAHLQHQVDAVYADFVGAVARGRGVTPEHVKKHFGQGRLFKAQESLARGLVDRIDTFDNTLERMVGRSSSGRGLRSRAAAGDWQGELSAADRDAIAIMVALSTD